MRISRFRPILIAGAALLSLTGSGVHAAEVPVAVSAPDAALVRVEWVHARPVAGGFEIAGRLRQSAGRMTRAGVPLTVAVAGAAPVQVRSSAFAMGDGGATFAAFAPAVAR